MASEQASTQHYVSTKAIPGFDYATTVPLAEVPRLDRTAVWHAINKMLFEKYSCWIDGADKGVQRAALQAVLGGNTSQILSNTAKLTAK